MPEFTTVQVEALEANLDGSKVKERAGFSYIEGWWAVREANRIFGHGNWTHEIRQMTPVVFTNQGAPNYQGKERKGYLIAFTAIVRVSVGNQVHEGVGYGEGIDYNNCGQAYESAVKEAETDAMKRALKNWGNPFGLALYDKDQGSVDRAPQDKGHGYCTIPGHNNAPFTQTDKQKAAGFAPSHKQGETWCQKPADAPVSPPERKQPDWMTEDYHAAADAFKVLFTDPDQRMQYVIDTIGRKIEHPSDVTAAEWKKVRQSAEGDLASMGDGTPGEDVEDLTF